MNILGFELNRATRRAVASELRSGGSIENPTVPVSQTSEFISFFGLDSVKLPRVTIDSALTVPAVAAAVAFLSRTLASLPLHAFQMDGDSKKRINGGIDDVVHNAWNDETDGFEARQYFWQQVFTGGRGLAWLERSAGEVVNIWPMVASKTRIKRVNNRKVYIYDGKSYPAADVIDVPFMLKPDQLGHYGPVTLGAKAIQLALAMNDYGSNFFAGGGVPPMSLEGPIGANGESVKRMLADIDMAISTAKQSGKPIMPIPGGYKFNPVGFDPAKGQMTEARLFQVQEIARVWQMPPAFLQDLSRGTFANVEQQDLHLVKHLIGQWTEALESEMTLKVFGRGRDRRGRWIEHNLDGLMRGDFKSRIDALARGIQTAQITPNEARALENRPKHTNPDAEDLLVQGATVPLGKQPLKEAPKDDGESDAAKDA